MGGRDCPLRRNLCRSCLVVTLLMSHNTHSLVHMNHEETHLRRLWMLSEELHTLRIFLSEYLCLAALDEHLKRFL